MSPQPTRWWLLPFSPTEMARFCRARPVLAKRLGITLAALCFAELFAFVCAFAGDPFGEPFAPMIYEYLAILFITWLALSAWVWVMPTGLWINKRPFKNYVIGLAALPAVLINTPDAAASVYREALRYANVGTNWQPAPWQEFVFQMSDTCMWFFAACFAWLAMAILASHKLRQLPFPIEGTHCPHCDYDLHGTRLAGIDRCPECGTDIPPLPEPESSPEETPSP